MTTACLGDVSSNESYISNASYRAANLELDQYGVLETINSGGNSTTHKSEAEDIAAIEDQASRLLRGEEGEVQILLGRLPKALEAGLKFPNGTEIVGCVIMDQRADAVLDVNQTPEQVLEFYKEQLAGNGWYISEEIWVPALNRTSLALCSKRDSTYLKIDAYARDEMPTEVRITRDNGIGSSPCMKGDCDDPIEILPKLVPPDESELSSSGHATYSSYGMLESELNLSAIANHYAYELERYNWTCLEKAQRNAVTSSRWAFTDESGRAFDAQLIIISLPFKDDEHLLLIASNQKGQNYLEDDSKEFKQIALSSSDAKERIRRLLPLISPLENIDIIWDFAPPGLPEDFPMPEGCKILGSLIMSNSWEVITEVPDVPAQAVKAYQNDTAALGWVKTWQSDSWGFTQDPSVIVLEQPKTNQSLEIQAFCRGKSLTDLHLKLIKDGTNYWRGVMRNSSPLIVPPEAKLLLAKQDEYCPGFSYAILETEMDISSLSSIFVEQMAEGKWTCFEEVKDDDAYASRWNHHDKEEGNKTCILLVYELPGAPKRYLAFLKVDNAPAQVSSSGGSIEVSEDEIYDGNPNGSEVLEVAKRLLSCDSRMGLFRYFEKQLLPGEIPSDLSEEIPISERGKVIGSIFPKAGSNSPESTRILLYTNETPQEALDFYKASLPSKGWINEGLEADSFHGFVNNESIPSKDWYHPQMKKHLRISSNAREGNFTEVEIELESIFHEKSVNKDICKVMRPIDIILSKNQTQREYFHLFRISLRDPANYFENRIIGSETDLNSSDLAGIYANRLYRANWTDESIGRNDNFLWQTFSLSDAWGSNWSGGLFSLKTNRTEDYHMISIWTHSVMPRPVTPEMGQESCGSNKAVKIDNYFMQQFVDWALDGSVIVGTPPRDMPFYPKLPEGARVIGGITEGSWFKILLETPKQPEEVLQFYREEMSKDNWSDVGENGWGFKPCLNRALFCNCMEDRSLEVNVIEQCNGTTKTGLTEVYLVIGSSSWIDWACEKGASSGRLPLLRAPVGSKEIYSFGSISEIVTEMNASTLEAHYSAQMSAANWTLLDGGHDGPIAWSKWTRNQNGYSDLLLVQDLPEKDHHILRTWDYVP
jgi:hypothetical protein